jgi:hypothetical protein
MSLISFRIGSIRHRLLVWNLSVFGLVLLGIVLANYFYVQRQIKEDSFELQAEIASLVAARIDAFCESKNRTLERRGSFYESPSGRK